MGSSRLIKIDYFLKIDYSFQTKNGPAGQWSERRLATMLRDNSEANWNGHADRQTDRTMF